MVIIHNSTTRPALDCFKAYDVRGKVPDQLNKDLAQRIGRAYALYVGPRKVAIGHDIRLSSPAIKDGLAEGLLSAGVDVADIGLCGTEEVYYAAFHLDVDGGIMITASHNPADYNGMKFVRKNAVPISGDSGLFEIAALAAEDKFRDASQPGHMKRVDIRPDFIDHILGYVDLTALKPMNLVINAGNGCAGPVMDLLEKRLPFKFIKLQHEPDGSFPCGVPNPLLPENRDTTAQAVVEHGADMGIAWDGDFDRCFLFDENGAFIEGYYIVGLLAEEMVKKTPGAKIVHDPRLIWNTREIVGKAGGVPIMSKSGHTFMKETMRAEDAAYGGEMSAHHFFRDFSYCDSGMIPWLLVCEILSKSGRKLSELVTDRIDAFPVSGEINSHVTDPDAVIEKIDSVFDHVGTEKDYTDGISVSTLKYRFNVRKSNTEPVLRLNVETRGNRQLLEEVTAGLIKLIKSEKDFSK
ncbi:MAG: phosphomannomutase [Thermodesulfobacteriota bacterium]|nr:phosphomannomutase [Thermodesulfobacteriota bacterium]